MKVFIHTNGNLAYQIADVDPNGKIGFLVNKYSTDESTNDDYIEDVEIYLKNKADDLDKGKTFSESGIAEGDHLFVGRCKTVTVTINYAGKEFDLTVPPPTIARKLRRKALEHFGISNDDGVDLLLWVNKETYLEDRNMIGSVTDYPKCAAELSLASKQDIQGAPAEEILKDHIESGVFQSGVMDESWGIENNDEGPKWPFVVFWVRAKNNHKYYFRFDLGGYNGSPPTAILWDPIGQIPLAQSKWPNWNKRTQQVFRKWNKPSLYLPCDRVAIQGHTQWPTQHAFLVWKAHTDNITKYLLELHQTLNQ